MSKSLNNIIQFPNVKQDNLTDKAVTLTNDIIYNILDKLSNNDIDIHDEDLQLELIGIVRIIRAMIDKQYGLENDLSEALKVLSKNVQETTA